MHVPRGRVGVELSFCGLGSGTHRARDVAVSPHAAVPGQGSPERRDIVGVECCTSPR